MGAKEGKPREREKERERKRKGNTHIMVNNNDVCTGQAIPLTPETKQHTLSQPTN